MEAISGLGHEPISQEMQAPADLGNGKYPVHYAAAMGQQKILRQLLDQDRSTTGLRDSLGRAPLIYAIVSSKLVCAEILLKYGADVNSTDEEGRSALHWVSFHGKVISQSTKKQQVILVAFVFLAV